MRNFWQPEELMQNYIRFKLHRPPSKPQWSTSLKNQSPKLFGLFTPNSRTIRNMYFVTLICLAILLFGTAASLRAQDEPKQDEPQQEGEHKKDKDQDKKEESKSEKNQEKRKNKQALPRLKAVIWHPTVDVNQLNLFYGAGGNEDAPTPDAKYKFKKEDMNGTSPKFDVEDD